MYERERAANSNRQQSRQSIRNNQFRITGRFYRKLNLTQRWEDKEKHHLASLAPFPDPDPNGPQPANLMTYHQLLARMRGMRIGLSEDHAHFMVYLESMSAYRSVLRPLYQQKFYRDERMIRETAQRRALRVVGSYAAGRITV